jgi:hypothetical protein
MVMRRRRMMMMMMMRMMMMMMMMGCPHRLLFPTAVLCLPSPEGAGEGALVVGEYMGRVWRVSLDGREAQLVRAAPPTAASAAGLAIAHKVRRGGEAVLADGRVVGLYAVGVRAEKWLQ